MKIIEELLRDDYSFKQAKALQIKYQNLLKIGPKDDYINNIKLIKTVLGVDVSYFREGDYEYGIACAVLWNLRENSKENHFFYKERINFPYKAGFLGFREGKVLAQVVLTLPIKPDLIMCDGHGKIHPRRFGEAVHLGYALDIPTLGIAKKKFIGFSDWDKIEKVKGKKVPVWEQNPNNIKKEESNELLGYAICLNNGLKPVFISEGYKISLDTALKICLKTNFGHRQPEPVYLADYFSRKEVLNYI